MNAIEKIKGRIVQLQNLGLQGLQPVHRDGQIQGLKFALAEIEKPVCQPAELEEKSAEQLKKTDGKVKVYCDGGVSIANNNPCDKCPYNPFRGTDEDDIYTLED